MKRNTSYRLAWGALILLVVICCKKSKAPVQETDDGIKYQTSTAIFPNPERGFMRAFPVYSEGTALNPLQVNGLRDGGVSLIQRVYYFDTFKDKALSQAELNLIHTDMGVVRDAGLKIVLRFAYTDLPNGTDAPLSIVKQHLDQLKPLFEENQDVIAFVQAGFIGPWGEWHDSTNGLGTVENEREVLNKLLSVLPQSVMVQVRTPGQKQSVFNTTLPVTKELAYTADGRARVGHHNDCFMTGGTNYGTYDNISADKKYINNEALYVPVGGETCPPEGNYSPNCTETKSEMKLLRWTYLNLDYYQPTLNLWKNSGCFDEFRRNLGYRLALVSAKLPDQAAPNGGIKISIKITNTGYAPLYHKKRSSLVLKNKQTNEFTTLDLAYDIRDCKPGSTSTIEETVKLDDIPAGSYNLYLKIADQAEALQSRAEYSVRLANTGTWVDQNGGMNDLKATLNVK